jgi:ADP-heptose:LPS heptosyltransferase
MMPIGQPIARCLLPAASARQRILIVRTIANGDILMSTPLIAGLRAALPDAHITYLVERREREAIEANPQIDRLLLWDTAYWKTMTRRGNYPLWFLRTRSLRTILRRERFDTLISLMPEDWPWLIDAVGATTTIGVFDTFREYHRQTRTSRRMRLYTHAFTFNDLPPHRTDQYLLPLQALGLPTTTDRRMRMGWTASDEAAADAYIREQGLGERFAVVAPRAGWPSRCWPIERWAGFCDGLMARHDCRILLVGGAGDRDALTGVADRISTATRPVVAAGAFGFRQLAALTRRALLTASGDTGPMHVAAAVGTPYLALFGPTPAPRFAPLVGRGLAMVHPVPCGPCHQRRCPLTGDDFQQCLRLITVKEALTSAGKLLN